MAGLLLVAFKDSDNGVSENTMRPIFKKEVGRYWDRNFDLQAQLSEGPVYVTKDGNVFNFEGMSLLKEGGTQDGNYSTDNLLNGVWMSAMKCEVPDDAKLEDLQALAKTIEEKIPSYLPEGAVRVEAGIKNENFMRREV